MIPHPLPDRYPGEPPWVRRLFLPRQAAQAESDAAVKQMAKDGLAPAGETVLDLILAGVPLREAPARLRMVGSEPGFPPYCFELEVESFAPEWAVDLAARLARLSGTTDEGRDVVLAEAVVTPSVRDALTRERTTPGLLRLYALLTT